MKYKVSVIIPIYNTSRYLSKCVESLMHQTLSDIEYIFINDASTDNSLDILRNTIKYYPSRHIKIVNLEKNKGISNARNIGISMASGDYITHCDSDDWVDLDAYSILYRIAVKNNSDITACNFVNEYDNLSLNYHQPYSNNMDENLKKLLNGDIFPSLWSSIIKRELIINNNIAFPEKLNMGEDLLFNIKAYYYANKIAYTNKTLYHYRHNENSVCIRRSNDSIYSDISIAKLIEEFLTNKGCNQKFDSEITYRKFYSKLALIHNFDNINNYKKWLKIFPETHKNIMSFNKIEPKLRILLWLASKHLFTISRTLSSILRWQNTIRNRKH